MSWSVDASAQCTSSSTTSSGASVLIPTSRSVTAVWNRWRSVSGSAAAGRGSSPTRVRELREDPGQLAAARPEMAPKHLGVGVAHQVLERPRVRAVRRPDDGVAVAVEHGRPFLRDVAGELAHEPALPRAGVAGDQRGAAPLPAERGSSARSVASSRVRPAKANAGESRSGPGSGTVGPVVIR